MSSAPIGAFFYFYTLDKLYAHCYFVNKVKIVKLWSWEGSPYLDFKDEENPSQAAKKAGIELWDPMNCPRQIIKQIKELV